MSKYFTCPNCGADVPIKARACPECGSDDETGWSEAAKYTHLLPDKGDGEIEDSKSKTWQKYGIAAIAFVLILGFLASQGLTWTIPAIALAALVGGGIYYLVRQYSQSSGGMQKQLYQQLLKRARGDRQLADRLIAYERERNPDANRLQILQNAIYRWDRDRR
jgi:hypothetical protein